MSADGQLKSIIERILRLHAEEDEIKSDRREVYGEAKANGYDKTALGAAVALIRKRDRLGEDAIAERETIVGLYLDAYDNAPRAHTHTPAREARAKARLSEAMDDNKALSAQMLEDGLISAEAHAENVALSDAVAVKLGAGVIAEAAPETRFNLPIAKPLRPNCLNREGCGSYTAEHCFICRQALENTEAA